MLINVVIAAVYGLVLLVLLWPTQSTAKRLLKRWEVPDPTPEQFAEAIRYLKRRRLLYPVLFVAVALVPKWVDSHLQLVVVGLAGTLLAELLALRTRRDALRTATLTPRGLFDIASKWVLGAYVLIVAGAAAYLVHAQQWGRLPWLALSAAAVAVIIWAAVARPAGGEQVVDVALRTRSVHVSAGLGAALAGVMIDQGAIGLVGILAWIAMANTTPKHMKIKR
ncbi:hypothetical protein [Lentzea sp. NPDC059081]|uniref:hypothetical protein n=1 Tax=Lentzea sp. NPDC059081 TaxID=3346719 RepID=UPI0036888526